MSVAEYEIYKRIKLLGEGAFGKAFLVECLKDQSLCVIKQVDLNNMPDSEKRETIKEAKILEALKHPNIVKFREVYKTRKGKLCIVMDYADGGDLTKHINSAKGSSIPENQIVDWFTQICLAMKHVHDRKILHRDLKCQNIFLTKTGIIKLGDFGIARVLSSTKENVRTMVGTPYYLSPEIIDNKPYSFKSDIWSLGVVLYELCALKPPFDAESLPKLAMKIIRGQYNPVPSHYSKELKNLIAATLSLDPQKRPSVHQILKMPLITNRIKSFLSESIRIQEFSHTILHNKKIDIRMRFEDVKQVMNEVPIPPSELRMQLLQEKKQKDYQERLEKEKQEKLEREKLEKQRLERERIEREKMEKNRKERERLEQELKEKENRIFGNKNRPKLFENEQDKSPLSRQHASKPFLNYSPYTPGPNILSRNKPEVYGAHAQTPNVEKRNNFNFFQRNDVKRNEVKPVFYAAPGKEVISELNVKRDVSPIRDLLARREDRRNNDSAENKVNGSAGTDNSKPISSERNLLNENNENFGLPQFRVEETKSDKTDRNHKISESPRDAHALKARVEASSFKDKENERKKKIHLKDSKEISRKKEREEVRDILPKNDSNKNSDGKEGKVVEMRNRLDEERKRMREDINLKKKTFKKSGNLDVEVFLPSSALDETEKDEFNPADDDDDDEPEEKIIDIKKSSKENVQKKDNKQPNPDITMDEENLIDMIHEMQQIVDESSDKEAEKEAIEEEEAKPSTENENFEDREDDEDESYIEYKEESNGPLKEISNFEVFPKQNIQFATSNITLKGFLDEVYDKETSTKYIEESKKLLSNLLDDVNLSIEDHSGKLKNDLCAQNPNLSSFSYALLFQALSEM